MYALEFNGFLCPPRAPRVMPHLHNSMIGSHLSGSSPLGHSALLPRTTPKSHYLLLCRQPSNEWLAALNSHSLVMEVLRFPRPFHLPMPQTTGQTCKLRTMHTARQAATCPAVVGLSTVKCLSLLNLGVQRLFSSPLKSPEGNRPHHNSQVGRQLSCSSPLGKSALLSHTPT